MTDRKEAIRHRFDQAARTYEAGAAAQRRIAHTLRDRLLQEPIPEQAEVLEVGCGTGLLTMALIGHLPASRWLATDISPRMLASCSARMDPRVTLHVMDGEFPDLEGRDFDLIVSSMAVQWFEDLTTGLRRLHGLLRPNGLLAVTTLGSATFHEWRTACLAAGVQASDPGYPTREELQRRLGPDAEVRQQACPVSFADIHGFLHHLKSIGARTAPTGHPPMPSGILKRILQREAGRPFTATYDVLTVLWRKQLPSPRPRNASNAGLPCA